MGKPVSCIDYRWIDRDGTFWRLFKQMERDERQAALEWMFETMRAADLQPTPAWREGLRELVASVNDEELMEQRGRGAMRETRALLARVARG